MEGTRELRGVKSGYRISSICLLHPQKKQSQVQREWWRNKGPPKRWYPDLQHVWIRMLHDTGGWGVAPQIFPHSDAQNLQMLIYSKRDFADVIKSRASRWGDYPRLFRWACPTLRWSFYGGHRKAEAKEKVSVVRHRGGNDVARRPGTLGKKRGANSPLSLQKEAAFLTPSFWSLKIYFGPLTSRTERE